MASRWQPLIGRVRNRESARPFRTVPRPTVCCGRRGRARAARAVAARVPRGSVTHSSGARRHDSLADRMVRPCPGLDTRRLGPPWMCHGPRGGPVEIGYIMRRDPEGTLRLTVSLGESVFSKAVSSNGATLVSMTSAAGEVASVAASHTAVIVSRGKRSVAVNVNGGHDDQLARVRTLLLGSVVIRAVRTQATVLEEFGHRRAGEDGRSPERRAAGATRRRYRCGAPVEPRAPRPVREHSPAQTDSQTNSWATYQAGVIRAAGHLETALDSFFLQSDASGQLVRVDSTGRTLVVRVLVGLDMPPGLAIAPERCIRLPNGETPR